MHQNGYPGFHAGTQGVFQAPRHHLQAPQAGWTLDSAQLGCVAKSHLPYSTHLCLDPLTWDLQGRCTSRIEQRSKEEHLALDRHGQRATLLAVHPWAEQQVEGHRLMSSVASGGGCGQISLHPNHFSPQGFPSVSVRSHFFEPNQFLALDLSQKAKKGSKRLPGKTFVPCRNMSRPVTPTVTPVPAYRTGLFSLFLPCLVCSSPLRQECALCPF